MENGPLLRIARELLDGNETSARALLLGDPSSATAYAALRIVGEYDPECLVALAAQALTRPAGNTSNACGRRPDG